MKRRTILIEWGTDLEGEIRDADSDNAVLADIRPTESKPRGERFMSYMEAKPTMRAYDIGCYCTNCKTDFDVPIEKGTIPVEGTKIQCGECENVGALEMVASRWFLRFPHTKI